MMVLEIDWMKEDGMVLGVRSMMMMEVLMKKMGGVKGMGKMIVIEEGWKGIGWGKMGWYMKYVYKRVRKLLGEGVVVREEVEEMIWWGMVKERMMKK